MASPESFCHEWFRRIWNELDTSAIDQLFAKDGLAHGLGPEPIRGPAVFSQFHRAFTDAFRDIKISVLHEVEQGQMVACYCRVTLAARTDPKPLAFEGCSFIRLRDRHIAEAWNAWDFLSLVEGMGILPVNALNLAIAGQLRANT
jgi:SnoaL-like polyketide cyclase